MSNQKFAIGDVVRIAKTVDVAEVLYYDERDRKYRVDLKDTAGDIVSFNGKPKKIIGRINHNDKVMYDVVTLQGGNCIRLKEEELEPYAEPQAAERPVTLSDAELDELIERLTKIRDRRRDNDGELKKILKAYGEDFA